MSLAVKGISLWAISSLNYITTVDWLEPDLVSIDQTGFWKMPISISRQAVENALNIIHEDDLVYFDFRCRAVLENLASHGCDGFDEIRNHPKTITPKLPAE